MLKTFRQSLDLINAGLDAKISRIGPAPILKIFATVQPETLAAPEPKALLVAIVLPDVWMARAKDGAAHMVGQWVGMAISDGTAKSFRLYSRGGTCVLDGAIPSDMRLNEPNIIAGKSVAVQRFSIFAGAH